MIELDSVSYSYGADQDGASFRNPAYSPSRSPSFGSDTEAVSNLSLGFEAGTFTAVVGANGSGKSTLAKLLNAILVPTKGRVAVDGMDSRDKANLYGIRSTVGLVFQNPDNQIVADTVEEDIAFGLENMGLPREEMRRRIDGTLSLTGLEKIRKSNPDKLSGGQKQLVAIAGVLAMEPRCIVLDEATSMLDPMGRSMVLGLCHELNRTLGMAVILVTHYMEECVDADRMVVMDHGRLAMDGTPRQVFSNAKALKSLGVGLPPATAIAYGLSQRGVDVPEGILTSNELCLELSRLRKNRDRTVEGRNAKGTGL